MTINRKFKSIVSALITIGVIGWGGYSKLEKNIVNTNDSSEKVVQVDSKSEKDFAGLKFDSKKYPENIVLVGNGKYQLTDDDMQKLKIKGCKDFWVEYSGLDNLGRTGEVDALVTKDSIDSHSSKNMKRPQFKSNVHVAGEYTDGTFNSEKQTWVGKHSNNKITQMDGYKGYVYNKSHSIAWSLGGDMDVHNLTLGTRAQNVGKNDGHGGMAYTETIVRNEVKKNPNEKVLYKVKPVYKGDELVPRGSHVEVYSINDEGNSINENVWVFNDQAGLTINYSTGVWN